MSNPWAPDESPAEIFADRMWLSGALVCNLAYGINATLAIICLYILGKQTNRYNWRNQLTLLTFISVVFLLGTLFMASNNEFTQLAFVENSHFPGGPGAYEEAMFSIPIDELGNATFVISNWLMDMLLVWRCMVIYRASGIMFRIVSSVTVLMMLASISLGALFLVDISASSPFSQVNFTLAYITTSLALNIVATILIVARILVYRHRLRNIMGSDASSDYISVVAMLVESAAIFSIFSILFLVPFGMNYPLAQVFIQSLPEIQPISSFLIILRVATGRAWTRETGTIMANQYLSRETIQFNDLSSMQFAPSDAIKKTAQTTETVSSITVAPQADPEQANSRLGCDRIIGTLAD